MIFITTCHVVIAAGSVIETSRTFKLKSIKLHGSKQPERDNRDRRGFGGKSVGRVVTDKERNHRLGCHGQEDPQVDHV